MTQDAESGEIGHNEPLPRVGLEPEASARSSRRGVGPLEILAKYGVLVTLLVMVAVFWVMKPGVFPTTANVHALLAEMAPIAIVSFGVTVVLIMGDFDLSIVGMIALASAVMVSLMSEQGTPPALVILVGFVLAGIVGLTNGTLIARFRSSSFIITLATGQVLTGIELQITEGLTIFEGIPRGFIEISTGKLLFGLQNSVWIAAIVWLITYLLLDHTAAGRYMYAIGGNPEAARLSGIPVTRLRMIGFVLVSTAGVIAAILLVGQAGAYSHELGATFLLPAYASVFLGASVLKPGTFNIVGTLIGAFFLAVLANGLTILSLSNSIVSIVQGALLAIAVLFASIQKRRNA